MGVCGHGALSHVGAKPTANVIAAICFVLGLIFFALANRTAAVVVPRVLSQLDEARLSAKGTATLTKSVKGTKAVLGYLLILSSLTPTLRTSGSLRAWPSRWRRHL